MPNRRLWQLPLAIAACTFACDDPDLQVPATLVRDSAGIRIVENARPSMPGAGRWAIVDEQPSLQVGAIEAEDAAYMFAGINDAVEAPNGDITVVDEYEIRVFDRAGRHRRTIGRRGMGPGEFNSRPMIRFISPDTILAWDGGLFRVTWFTLDGNIAKEHSLAGINADESLGLALRSSAWEVHPAGTVVGQRSDPAPPNADNVSLDTKQLHIVDIASGNVSTIRGLPGYPGIAVGETGFEAILHPTIGRGNWNLRVSVPTIIAADDDNGRWVLSVYDFNGRLVESVRAALPRTPITNELLESTRSFLTKTADGLPPAQRQKYAAAVQRMPLPDSAPAISAVLIDADDQLWVQRWRPFWEQDGLDTYDVFDPNEHWLGWIEIDRSLGEILSMGRDHILFAARDSFDVPILRKHRLRRLDREARE